MHIATRSEAEVALEICQSVEQSNEKQKRLKSSTFWRLFGVKSRQKKVVDRINQLLEEQGLKVSVKSEAPLGEEKDDDWIILTLEDLKARLTVCRECGTHYSVNFIQQVYEMAKRG